MIIGILKLLRIIKKDDESEDRSKGEKTLFTGILIILCSVALCGCQSNSQLIEPDITYSPPSQFLQSLPPAFPELAAEELQKDWGKELLIANSFALEMDLYRAITSYKRALVLIPPKFIERRMQIEYGIIQCYYLGKKFQEVVIFFDNSLLRTAPESFPAFDDLLIIIEDSYLQIGQHEKAYRIFGVIEARTPEIASNLQLSEMLVNADFASLQVRAGLPACERFGPSLGFMLNDYHLRAKSVSKAQTLNAVLPGAGYYYVGQKRTALTSFVINALFIAAAYHFFDQGNIAAGIITASFETGWYFGGINGAGLAAKAYNECLYGTSAKEYLLKQRLFPVLQLHYSF